MAFGLRSKVFRVEICCLGFWSRYFGKLGFLVSLLTVYSLGRFMRVFGSRFLRGLKQVLDTFGI